MTPMQLEFTIQLFKVGVMAGCVLTVIGILIYETICEIRDKLILRKVRKQCRP